MLLHEEEQKNPIEYRGRKIVISDKVVKAHFYMCNLPINERSVEMYVSFYLNGNEENLAEKVNALLDAKLTQIVEDGVKEEFVGLFGEKAWNDIEG